MNDDYRKDPLIEALRRIDPAISMVSPSTASPKATELIGRMVALDREPRRRRPAITPLRQRRHWRSRVLVGRRVSALVTAGILLVGLVALLAVRNGAATAPTTSATNPAVAVTAAMVQEMAAKTRAEVAKSGTAQVAFTSTLDGGGSAVQVTSGSSTIAFFGSDVSVDSQFTTLPGYQDGQPSHQVATFGILAGREYGLYKGRWYLLPSRPSASDGLLQPDTDPRTFLQTLSPAAMFKFVDRENIGGVELSHLRAANRDLTIPIQQHVTWIFSQRNGKDIVERIIMTWDLRITALNVWVDGGGIVHRLDVTMSLSTDSVSLRPALAIVPPPVESTTQVMSLTFSHLGAREIISAPAHPDSNAPPGCGGSDACVIPAYGSFPPFPLSLKP
jgi:hypothetical protein